MASTASAGVLKSSESETTPPIIAQSHNVTCPPPQDQCMCNGTLCLAVDSSWGCIIWWKSTQLMPGHLHLIILHKAVPTNCAHVHEAYFVHTHNLCICVQCIPCLAASIIVSICAGQAQRCPGFISAMSISVLFDWTSADTCHLAFFAVSPLELMLALVNS